MRNYRFGRPWDAPAAEFVDPVETPVGAVCLDCGEPIVEGDRGLVIPCVGAETSSLEPVHLECHLRGTLSHVFGQCRCFVPGRSRREEALATLGAINTERAAAGLGKL